MISPAVELQGGTLLHPIESVRVRALPDHLPQSIEYSIESLGDFDTTIHVRDLTVPSDVTLLTDGDEIIAKVQAPRVEEVVEVAAEAGEGAPEGEEAAEGAAAEGETAADRVGRGLRFGRVRRRQARDRRPESRTRSGSASSSDRVTARPGARAAS